VSTVRYSRPLCSVALRVMPRAAPCSRAAASSGLSTGQQEHRSQRRCDPHSSAVLVRRASAISPCRDRMSCSAVVGGELRECRSISRADRSRRRTVPELALNVHTPLPGRPGSSTGAYFGVRGSQETVDLLHAVSARVATSPSNVTPRPSSSRRCRTLAVRGDREQCGTYASAAW